MKQLVLLYLFGLVLMGHCLVLSPNGTLIDGEANHDTHVVKDTPVIKNPTDLHRIPLKISSLEESIPPETISNLDDIPKSESKPTEKATTNSPDDWEPDNKKSFSLLIPVSSIKASSDPFDSRDGFFGSGASSLSQMMRSIFRNMMERAKPMIDFARQQQRNALGVQEGRFSFDGDTGESVSVQRSMSVMMTKDKDGKDKMVVMRTPPKITIHRPWNPFAFDQTNGVQNGLNNRLKQLEREEEARIQNSKEDDMGLLNSFDKYIRSRIFPLNPLKPKSSEEILINGRPLWNKNFDLDRQMDDSFGQRLFKPIQSIQFGFNNHKNSVPPNDEDDRIILMGIDDQSSSTWSSFVVTMMPFLYMFLVILLLYTIIWLFYSVPSYLLKKSKRTQQRQNRDRGNSNEGGNDESIDKHRKFIQKLFHLSKARRYTQLAPFGEKLFGGTQKGNLSPSSSTLSFPPPYAEAAAKETACLPKPTNHSEPTILNQVVVDKDSQK